MAFRHECKIYFVWMITFYTYRRLCPLHSFRYCWLHNMTIKIFLHLHKFFLHRANKLGCYDNYSTLIPSIKQDIIIFWCKIVKNSINYSLKFKPESYHLNNYRNKTEENNQEKNWRSTLSVFRQYGETRQCNRRSNSLLHHLRPECLFIYLQFVWHKFVTIIQMLANICSQRWVTVFTETAKTVQLCELRPMFLTVYSIEMGQHFHLSHVYFVFFSHLKQMSLILLPSNTHMLPTACCTACNKPF